MSVSTSYFTKATSPTLVIETVTSSASVYTITIQSSVAVVDVFTKAPGQTEFISQTETWWTFGTLPSSTGPNSPTSPTGLNTNTGIPTTSAPTNTGIPTTSAPTNTVRSSSPSSIGSVQPTQAQSTQAYSSSNISRGATAGIAVGCVVAGLLIGLIAGCFLFRRQKQKRAPIRYHATRLDSQEKPLQEPRMDRLELDQFLLDSTPDAEIRTELRALNHLLQQHVENNYHLQPISYTANDISQRLLQLGLGQGGTMAATKLASLSLDPKNRYSTIQHVIARVTFASVAFNEASHYSLLPQPVSSFTSMIPAVEGRTGNRNAVNVALTRWRQLSAFLLHPERSDRTPLTPPEDVSTHKAQQLAMNLNAFLQPFVTGGLEDRYEQENHLREVIAECTTFGYRLFSQPSEYRFRFEDGVSPNSIVVCPGLDRISDEEGTRFPMPTQPIVAPVVETI